jgi:hypothetical protein
MIQTTQTDNVAAADLLQQGLALSQNRTIPPRSLSSIVFWSFTRTTQEPGMKKVWFG